MQQRENDNMVCIRQSYREINMGYLYAIWCILYCVIFTNICFDINLLYLTDLKTVGVRIHIS